MAEDIFSDSLLEEGRALVSAKQVANVIFSKGTYQAEVVIDGAVNWTFLQLSSDHFSDLFCECGGSKSAPCNHLAASVEAIYYGHKDPLHVRYEASFWKKSLEVVAERLGYDTSVLKKEGETYSILVGEKKVFSLVCKSARAKEHFRITVDERVAETEETSIKFSNLDADELERYQAGNPSQDLRFELSFWSDLAKYFLYLEDESALANIDLPVVGKELPKEIKVEMEDFFFSFEVEKGEWEAFLPSLKDRALNLPVHDMTGREIEKVVYNKADHSFSLIASGKTSTVNGDGILLGDWKFVPGKGFFPKDNDPILEQDIIREDGVEEALNKYGEKFSEWLEGERVTQEVQEVQFTLFFDEEQSLHISMYLFEKGDLAKGDSHLYGAWAYVEGKGFYPLKGQLFTGRERIIKNEVVTEFIDRHKTFLSGFDGFAVHMTNIESSVRYEFNQDTLEILGDELHDEESGVVDCGKYLYVKGQGFFIQGIAKYDKHVFPGMRIEKDELSHFITVNKEELETVTGFFVQM